MSGSIGNKHGRSSAYRLGVEAPNDGLEGWEPPARQTADGATSARVLLVEDEADIRESVKSMLEDRGYRVTCAANGWEALELLRSGGPSDLIVLDLRMPIMDGWEFRAVQKRNPDLADIPVVAISADESAQATSIDAAAYMRKPINPDSLLETVDRVLTSCLHDRARRQLDEVRRASALARLAASVGREIDSPLLYLMISVDVVAQDLERLSERSDGNAGAGMAGQLDQLCQMLRDCRRELDRIRKLLGVLQKLAPSLDLSPRVLTLPDDRPAEVPGGARGRVLVIDDEPIMGRTIRKALAEEYEVVAVAVAGEAFARLAAGEMFDVVLCDLFMPETNGREVYERLISDWPNVARNVVFMSDAAFISEVSELVNRTSRRVLFKPFQIEELRAVVRAQLEERARLLN